MNRIKELENEINNLCEQDKFNDELFTKLSDELRKLDPYNDMFHLACPSWPNCDIVGCEKNDWL